MNNNPKDVFLYSYSFFFLRIGASDATERKGEK